MAIERGGRAVVRRQLQTLFQAGAIGHASDGQLLEWFTTRRDDLAEPAFTVLVERHGPMVWRVCRRVLDDPDDAQDAFQTTFLTLVRQAATVRKRDSLASWLHGVAHRVACGVRSARARRRKHEQHYAERNKVLAQAEPAPEAELARLLEEELSRLPDRFRAPLLLCDLADATHEQAAAQLGWPVGTVKSRLSRGRARLRSRLIRRGLAPALAAAGSIHARSAVAVMPPPLVDATVQAALDWTAGRIVSPAIAGVVMKEVSKAMGTSHLRTILSLAFAAGLIGLGGIALWQRSEARQPPSNQPTAHDPEDATWARHSGNLKRIGLALVNYQDAEGSYPPAAITDQDGKPLLSWRVAILPYLEGYDGQRYDTLFKKFRLDEPWDSPHNKALLAKMPAVFASPGGKPAPFTTPYRGFVSPAGSQESGAAMGGMMSPLQGNADPEGPAMAGGAGMSNGATRDARIAMMAGMMAGRPGAGDGGGMMAGGQSPETAGGRAMMGMSPESRMSGMMGRASGQVGATSGGAGAASGGMMRMMMRGMGGGPPQNPAPPSPGTLFREGRGVEIQEITDGTSNTLMVVEAAEAVPWTKPDDLRAEPGKPLPRLGGSMREGFAVLFADGRVRFLGRDLDEATARKLVSINGGEVVSHEQLPSPEGWKAGAMPLTRENATPAEPTPAVETPVDSAPEARRYTGAGTLGNALGILNDALRREGNAEMGAWLSEPSVRRTIASSLRVYETALRRIGEPQAQRAQFAIVRPIYERIARDGTWPADCWFSTSSSVETRDGITYEHRQVHLNVQAADGGRPFTFQTLVLDLYRGPIEPNDAAQ
jgi:RNA polymerase sigma factor (sigma-70 family)